MIDEYVVRIKAETAQFKNSLNDLKSQMKSVSQEGKGLSQVTKDLKSITKLKLGKEFTQTLSRGMREIKDSLRQVTSDLKIKTTEYKDYVKQNDNSGDPFLATATDAQLYSMGLMRITDEFGNIRIVTKDVAEQIEKLGNEIRNLSERKTELSGYTEEFKKIKEGFQDLNGQIIKVSDLGKLSELIGQMGEFAEKTRNVSPAMEELYQKMQHIDAKGIEGLKSLMLNWSDEAMARLNKELKGLGISLDDAKEKEKDLKNAADKTTDSIKKQGNQTDKSSGKMSKFLSRVKTMILYRMIRNTMTQISNAIKEGIDNLYQYSKATDGVFSSVMDSYSTYSLYIKNSFATVIAPLLQSLLPAFKQLANWIAQATDKIAEFFAALRGESFYYSAVLAMKEYADATEKAVQENKKLKYLISGFDELNIYTPTKESGSSTATTPSATDMFKQVAVSVDMKNYANEIIEWWDTNILPTIDDIKKTTEKLFEDINWENLGIAFDDMNMSGLNLFSALLKLVAQIYALLEPLLAWVISEILPRLGEISVIFTEGVTQTIDGIRNISSGIADGFNAIAKLLKGDFSGAGALFESGAEKLEAGFKDFGLGTLKTLFAPLMALGWFGDIDGDGEEDPQFNNFNEVIKAIGEELATTAQEEIDAIKTGMMEREFTPEAKETFDNIYTIADAAHWILNPAGAAILHLTDAGLSKIMGDALNIEPSEVNLKMNTETIAKGVIEWFNTRTNWNTTSPFTTSGGGGSHGF